MLELERYTVTRLTCRAIGNPEIQQQTEDSRLPGVNRVPSSTLAEKVCLYKRKRHFPFYLGLFNTTFLGLLPTGPGRPKKSAFYSSVSKSMRSQVTANLAMSMAVDSQTWRALYGSGAAEALRRDKPHISRADWPRVMVRVAHFDQPTRTLRFTLTPGGAAVAASIVECAGLGSLRVAHVTRDSGTFDGWRQLGGVVQLVTAVEADAVFEVQLVDPG